MLVRELFDDLVDQRVFNVLDDRRVRMRLKHAGISGDTNVVKPGIAGNSLHAVREARDGNSNAGYAGVFSGDAGARTRGRAATSSSVAGDHRINA